HFAHRQAFEDERFPLEVLQHEVGDEVVIRDRRDADLLAVGRVRLVLVQVFGGDQRSPADRLLPEKDQRQQEQQGDDGEIGQTAAHNSSFICKTEKLYSRMK